ncbi:HNH endonuclease [Gordonia sp. VNK21]|uniref:HNH endonuclease n=1 Tax=Gordonia sp. VNK21 TaxID=3382483 RepID=UPI0038D389E6
MSKRVDWTWPELVLAVALRERAGWTGTLREDDDRIVELSDFLRSANPQLALTDPAFRSPGSVKAKLENIRTAHPDYQGKPTRAGSATRIVVEAFVEDPERLLRSSEHFRETPELIWREFAATDDEYIDLDQADPEGPASAVEGAIARRLAVYRERDPKLRKAKIDEAWNQRGSISCETCGFDFEVVYGDLGEGYTHVHHVVPLHVSGPVRSELHDLLLVCANCHVMIHRRAPWKQPHELAAIINRDEGQS